MCSFIYFSKAQSLADCIEPYPTITAVDTLLCNLTGGCVVHISGTNFAPDARVFVGDRLAVSTVFNQTDLEFIAPAQNASGYYTILVMDPSNPRITDAASV